MAELPISELPRELSDAEAIEAAHRDELDRAHAALEQSLSVLIECDKAISLHLYAALRQRLKRSGRRCRLISGHGATDGPSLPFLQRTLADLREAIFDLGDDAVIVLPHLDVLTTTTRSGLSTETREAAGMLFENPNATFLAFKDPGFELPAIINALFPTRLSLLGIPRSALPRLILQREARKLALETFSPTSLYSYVSGLNPIRLRQVLRSLQGRVDFDPAAPGSAREILKDIRRLTIIGDVELPQVDLDADIGGYDEVKRRLREEVLELLARRDALPDEAEAIEALVPRGLILHGPPGTGKTWFAKALATALEATITIVSGPELKSRWVGESEANLRQAFARARQAAPSIIVFDELDSFAARRGTFTGSGVEHSMVNQLLTEMDGFRAEELVFVIGTTNFVESLDPALLRPGRFELNIAIGPPEAEDRRAILTIQRRRYDLDLPDEVLEYAVERTAGSASEGQRFTGDHLNALARALARRVRRRIAADASASARITRADVDAVLPARRRPLNAEERRAVATHECGHAVVAATLPDAPPIRSVTVETDDDAVLGYVAREAQRNPHVRKRSEILDEVCVLLAGREAEALLLGDVTWGAQSDLARANELLRAAVGELGMSDAGLLVPLPEQPLSEAWRARLDDTCAQLLEGQRARARALLEAHRGALKALAERLIQAGRLGPDDLRELLGSPPL